MLSAKVGKLFGAGLLGLFLFTVTGVHAMMAVPVTVTDVNPNDANTITWWSYTPASRALTVWENYGESSVLPYQPSHDGWAVVNPSGGYFDKVVNFYNGDPTATYDLHFYVTNLTPYTWSDYHFEFWNADFTQRLANVSITALYSDTFANHSLADKDGVSNTVAQFWAPGWLAAGQTGEFVISGIPGSVDGSFGIRQVATVPEPETYAMMLAGIGLLGAVARRRKSKQAA